MFKFFEKKKSDSLLKSASLYTPDYAIEALSNASFTISLQIVLFPSMASEIIRSPYSLGYIYGFFDAAMQMCGARQHMSSQNVSLAIIDIGLNILISKGYGHDKFIEAKRLMLAYSGCEDFNKAQKIGGKEYYSFMNSEISAPIGIIPYAGDDLEPA